MPEHQSNIVKELQALVAQAPDSEPLPRLGNVRRFGLAFAGALDKDFQRNVAGPQLRRDDTIPQLEIARSEASRQQRIAELEGLLDIFGKQDAEARAEDVLDIQQAAAQRAEEAHDLGLQDRQAQDDAVAFQSEQLRSEFQQAEGGYFAAADSVIEATKGTEREAVGQRYSETIVGLVGILREAILSGPPPGAEEAWVKSLNEKGAILDSLVSEGMGILEGVASNEEAVKAKIAAQLSKGPKISSEAQLKLAGLDTSERQAQKFLQFQLDNPDVGGTFAGPATPDRFSPLQTEKQALVNTIIAPFLKMLSGAAVTPEEFERIRGLLPDVNVSDEINRIRVAAFLDFVRTSRSSIERRFGIIADMGIDVSKLSPQERMDLSRRVAAQAASEGFTIPLQDLPVPEGMEVEQGNFIDAEPPTNAASQTGVDAGSFSDTSRKRAIGKLQEQQASQKQRRGDIPGNIARVILGGSQVQRDRNFVQPPPDTALPLHLRKPKAKVN